jgi:oligopeptide/dipeptide ABC transporter ATP-binding protein
MSADAPVLILNDVAVHFPIVKGFLLPHVAGLVRAVDGVSLAAAPGEIVGIVGESGCGKSTLARAALRLAPLSRGSVCVDGRDLAAMEREELRRFRPSIQMVFQNPFASLDPRMSVHAALHEAISVRAPMPPADRRRRIILLLEQVGLEPRDAGKYPHEFSGGQRQRIAIARALAAGPRVLIADEPVSALDVSIQAQILNLLMRLRQDLRLAMLFISHDLLVVHHIADRIAVMYLGRIVEIGPADAVYREPAHPYTRALMSAAPRAAAGDERHERIMLTGEPPSPSAPPPGCPFHPRCRYAVPACKEALPSLGARAPGSPHQAACIRLGSI